MPPPLTWFDEDEEDGLLDAAAGVGVDELVMLEIGTVDMDDEDDDEEDVDAEESAEELEDVEEGAEEEDVVGADDSVEESEVESGVEEGALLSEVLGCAVGIGVAVCDAAGAVTSAEGALAACVGRGSCWVWCCPWPAVCVAWGCVATSVLIPKTLLATLLAPLTMSDKMSLRRGSGAVRSFGTCDASKL